MKSKMIKDLSLLCNNSKEVSKNVIIRVKDNTVYVGVTDGLYLIAYKEKLHEQVEDCSFVITYLSFNDVNDEDKEMFIIENGKLSINPDLQVKTDTNSCPNINDVLITEYDTQINIDDFIEKIQKDIKPFLNNLSGLKISCISEEKEIFTRTILYFLYYLSSIDDDIKLCDFAVHSERFGARIKLSEDIEYLCVNMFKLV